MLACSNLIICAIADLKKKLQESEAEIRAMEPPSKKSLQDETSIGQQLKSKNTQLEAQVIRATSDASGEINLLKQRSAFASVHCMGFCFSKSRASGSGFGQNVLQSSAKYDPN